MKKILLLGLLVCELSMCLAQEQKAGKQSKFAATKVGAIINDFSLGFPVIYFDLCEPLKDPKIKSLPEPLGTYAYYTKPSLGLFVPINTGSFRLFNLLYKERFGIELNWAEFTPKVDPNILSNGLVKAFPGYYISSALYGTQSDFYATYRGWLYGASYKIHVNKFVLEPKLLLGNMEMDTNPSQYQFKEKGSNSYLKYNISSGTTDKNACYQFQLNFARRFSGWNPHYMVEVGVHSSYTNIAYKNKVTITQQNLGMDPVIQDISYKGNYEMLAAGVYYALYFGKKHEPAKKKNWFSGKPKAKKK